MPDSRSFFSPGTSQVQQPLFTRGGTIRAIYDSPDESPEATVEQLNDALDGARARLADVDARYGEARGQVRKLRDERSALIAVKVRAQLTVRREVDNHALSGKVPAKAGVSHAQVVRAERAYEHLEAQLVDALRERSRLGRQRSETTVVIATLESELRHREKRGRRVAAQRTALDELTQQILAAS